jgi:hypothetical protein
MLFHSFNKCGAEAAVELPVAVLCVLILVVWLVWNVYESVDLWRKPQYIIRSVHPNPKYYRLAQGLACATDPG